MNWSWDVDYMSYTQLESLIKSKGYKDIRCIWYWDPKYSFSRGLRPLNNDNDVLPFSKDVIGFELIDVYIEYNVDNLEMMDPNEVGTNFFDDGDVQYTGVRNENKVNNNCRISENTILQEAFVRSRKNDSNRVVAEFYLFQKMKEKISIKPFKEIEDGHRNHIRVRESITQVEVINTPHVFILNENLLIKLVIECQLISIVFFE